VLSETAASIREDRDFKGDFAFADLMNGDRAASQIEIEHRCRITRKKLLLIFPLLCRFSLDIDAT
jgi:hypothetical protein